jgi:hypothetical protein
MDQLLAKLSEQWAVISGAPFPFVLAVAIVGGAIWVAVNWSYGTILASKNAELELADRQLADYKTKLSGATPDEAARRIAELERKVAAVGPRQLSPDQRQSFARAVALPAGTNYSLLINIDMLCNDCAGLAEQFQQALAAVPGWNVAVGRFAGGGAPLTGLVVAVSDTQNKPLEAVILANALMQAGQQPSWVSQPPPRGGPSTVLVIRPAN